MTATISTIIFNGRSYTVVNVFVDAHYGELRVQFYIEDVLMTLPIVEVEMLINEPISIN